MIAKTGYDTRRNSCAPPAGRGLGLSLRREGDRAGLRGPAVRLSCHAGARAVSFGITARDTPLAYAVSMSLISLYSMESANAMRLASIMSGETPTVFQLRRPSVDSIKTRTCAAVASLPSMTLTL